AAEQQWLREQEGREEREAEQAEIQAFLRDRRRNYKAHLVAYVSVNLFLFIISIMGGEFWFIYPLLGWGIGLAMHTWYMNQTEGETFERELEQWRSQRRLTRGNPPSLTS
ncbi:MAG TPA: 2TM domain-containing protein, partial [Ardenticatenaceae bacterium]